MKIISPNNLLVGHISRGNPEKNKNKTTKLALSNLNLFFSVNENFEFIKLRPLNPLGLKL